MDLYAGNRHGHKTGYLCRAPNQAIGEVELAVDVDLTNGEVWQQIASELGVEVDRNRKDIGYKFGVISIKTGNTGRRIPAQNNRQPPDLSVDGPTPEGAPNPVELHAIHAAQRSNSDQELAPPVGSIAYTAAELEAAGGILVYAPEPHNPYHYNVEFRALAGLSGGALRRARRAIKDQLKRTSFGWTPP